MQKRPRLIDVASRAGVAPNTASTILNRKSGSWASQETRERVMRAADELGYRPSKAALGIRTGRFHSVGLVIPDLHNPFYTAFADLLDSALQSEGYDLIIEHSRNNLVQERHCFEAILSRQVDGAAFFLSEIGMHRDFLTSLSRQKFPSVALAAKPDAPLPVDAVVTDFSPGLIEAVDHLVALGHRRIAFLCALAEGQDDGHRPELFGKLLAARGVDDSAGGFIRCSHEIDGARRAFLDFLNRPSARRPTAVIAMNDLSAIGAIRAAVDAGIKVPADLSVIGVDNIPLGIHLPVALTTIAQPIEDMARRTASILIGRIKEGRTGRPTQTVFPTELIVRESTSAAAAET